MQSQLAAEPIGQSRNRLFVGHGKIDETWSYFEYDWAPKRWSWAFRFVIYRQRVKVKRKGALQLDVFEPREWAADQL